MARRTIEMEMKKQISILQSLGYGKNTTTRELGLSKNTVKRYLDVSEEKVGIVPMNPARTICILSSIITRVSFPAWL